MTVCVAIKVYDCIVFAADSAVSTSFVTQEGLNVYNNVWKHGIKVFNLHRKLPIVAMSAGLANFGPMSVTNLAKDFRSELMDGSDNFSPDSYTLEDVSKRALSFFKNAYENYSQHVEGFSFGFWIGGYSGNKKQGEIWKIEMTDGKWHNPNQLVAPETDSRVLWGGQTNAIYRLVLGYDPQIYQILESQKLDDDQIENIQKELLNIQTPLIHSSMPVQDAINVADFLVEMTKKYVKYLPGADTVGGDTDIATVTKHEGFKWISRKHYYSRHLNTRDTDHAT